MIYCLNNMKGFSHRYNVDEQRKCMDHNTYIVQNNGIVGKVVHLKFKDESQQLTRMRLNINKNNFPDFTGINTYDDWYFKIVRFDATYPYICILVDKNNRVIVTTTQNIGNLFVYPGYEFKTYDGYEELILPSVDWNIFNHKYQREVVYNFPIQDTDYIARPVYIEYYNDLFNLNYKKQLEEIDLSDRKLDIEKIREKIISVNPNLDVFDNSFLIRYPAYYENHLKDMLDIPLRVVHKGYVIRVDKNANEAFIVVIQMNEDGSYRFLTDREATFYFDENKPAIFLEDLNLWQK